MVSIKELKKFQKPKEFDDFFTSRIYRRISIFLSWFFINIGIGANMVSFLGLILDLVTVYFVFAEHWIVAGILVQLFIVWDCVDGEIARYTRSRQKRQSNKKYGYFLDELLGLMGFYFIILLAGAGTDFVAGILASYALLLLNFSSVTAGSVFESKKIAKQAQGGFEKMFGLKIKGRLGFTADIQRTLISLVLFFHTAFFLWVYFVGAMVLVAIKFWVYRKE